MSDELGDRMKLYEGIEAGRKLMPLLPCFARIDGRAFHSFTAGMRRPYDQRISDLMIDTTKYLVKATNACMGYTQSDEITLAWYSSTTASQIYFDGRVCKMISMLAAEASTYFREAMPKYFEGEDLGVYRSRKPLFDARVWNVPTLMEGTNVFLWREWDATKNSISMAARAHFSHNEVDGKNGSDMQEMLWSQRQVNWNDYPAFFKRGSYIQRRIVPRKFTTDELDKLPPRHAARANPDLMVERTDYVRVEMPPFTKVLNKIDVIFNGIEPIVECVPDEQ